MLNFRTLADGLGDLYFRPLSSVLEIYLLKDPATANPICAWIRSPESFDVRLDVLNDPANEQSAHVDYSGRKESVFSGRN